MESYKDPIQLAQEALATEAKKPRNKRLTRKEIAERAGVSVPYLALIRAGKTPNAAYRRIQAVLRVLAMNLESRRED